MNIFKAIWDWFACKEEGFSITVLPAIGQIILRGNLSGAVDIIKNYPREVILLEYTTKIVKDQEWKINADNLTITTGGILRWLEVTDKYFNDNNKLTYYPSQLSLILQNISKYKHKNSVYIEEDDIVNASIGLTNMIGGTFIPPKVD